MAMHNVTRRGTHSKLACQAPHCAPSHPSAPLHVNAPDSRRRHSRGMHSRPGTPSDHGPTTPSSPFWGKGKGGQTTGMVRPPLLFPGRRGGLTAVRLWSWPGSPLPLSEEVVWLWAWSDRSAPRKLCRSLVKVMPMNIPNALPQALPKPCQKGISRV